MMKPSDQTPLSCPECGEPIQPHWKICPACETRLIALTCPACGQPVKENWKRCPECDTRLTCAACGRRLPPGSVDCPHCNPRPSAAVHPISEFIEPVTGMTFVRLPGGTFMMGDTYGDGMENELPVHEVRLGSFYIARHPVTQSQWLAAMPENPAAFAGGDRPVEQVSWTAVQDFLHKLAELNHGRYSFRLPTEAEWEYAARGGGKPEKFAGGDDPVFLAWYDENSDGATHPVGLKRPNGLGLHDMSGNVWEWCQDLFDENAYAKHTLENPLIDARGENRVIRGGSWNVDAWSIRCARRMGFSMDFHGPALGFRVVMDAGDK